MDISNKSEWYSGDWRYQNNSRVPYNGIKIVATANYGPVTSPPSSKQQLISVGIEIVDFTFDPEGVSSSVTLFKTGSWYNIPIPADYSLSPPMPNANFTIDYTVTSGLGRLKLDSIRDAIYINVEFSYGMPSRNREVAGYIMRFDRVYEKEDPFIMENWADYE